MTHKITLVDDDQNILTSVSISLESEGFDVKTYTNGEEGLNGINQSKPDIAILDIKMPKMDGIEVITKIRQNKDTENLPVIFLTSKDDEIDEVIGLRMGADDYITKPFSQRLLIERIKTLLRRQDNINNNNNKSNEDIITKGDLTLDDARHLCSWKRTPINLTVTEYLLIKALAIRPGHVKNRDQLIDLAYGEQIYVDDRTIDSHIKRLRKKFRNIDNDFDRIETLYGVGYKYKE